MRRALLALVVMSATLFGTIAPVELEAPASVVEECTEADGACLTWDDIRESEWHTD